MIDSHSLLSTITTGILSVIVTRMLIRPRCAFKACCMVSAAAAEQRKRASSS